MRFEYRILKSTEQPVSEDTMNSLGKAGWDLIQIVEADRGVWFFYFKRRVTDIVDAVFSERSS